jgi:hypothetical protein
MIAENLRKIGAGVVAPLPLERRMTLWVCANGGFYVARGLSEAIFAFTECK